MAGDPVGLVHHMGHPGQAGEHHGLGQARGRAVGGTFARGQSRDKRQDSCVAHRIIIHQRLGQGLAACVNSQQRARGAIDAETRHHRGINCGEQLIESPLKGAAPTLGIAVVGRDVGKPRGRLGSDPPSGIHGHGSHSRCADVDANDHRLALRHGDPFRLPALSDWRYFSASQPSNSACSASVRARNAVAGAMRLATSARQRIMASAPALAWRATNTPWPGKTSMGLADCSKSRAVSPALAMVVPVPRKIT